MEGGFIFSPSVLDFGALSPTDTRSRLVQAKMVEGSMFSRKFRITLEENSPLSIQVKAEKATDLRITVVIDAKSIKRRYFHSILEFTSEKQHILYPIKAFCPHNSETIDDKADKEKYLVEEAVDLKDLESMKKEAVEAQKKKEEEEAMKKAEEKRQKELEDKRLEELILEEENRRKKEESLRSEEEKKRIEAEEAKKREEDADRVAKEEHDARMRDLEEKMMIDNLQMTLAARSIHTQTPPYNISPCRFDLTKSHVRTNSTETVLEFDLDEEKEDVAYSSPPISSSIRKKRGKTSPSKQGRNPTRGRSKSTRVARPKNRKSGQGTSSIDSVVLPAISTRSKSEKRGRKKKKRTSGRCSELPSCTDSTGVSVLDDIGDIPLRSREATISLVGPVDGEGHYSPLFGTPRDEEESGPDGIKRKLRKGSQRNGPADVSPALASLKEGHGSEHPMNRSLRHRIKQPKDIGMTVAGEFGYVPPPSKPPITTIDSPLGVNVTSLASTIPHPSSTQTSSSVDSSYRHSSIQSSSITSPSPAGHSKDSLRSLRKISPRMRLMHSNGFIKKQHNSKGSSSTSRHVPRTPKEHHIHSLIQEGHKPSAETGYGSSSSPMSASMTPGGTRSRGYSGVGTIVDGVNSLTLKKDSKDSKTKKSEQHSEKQDKNRTKDKDGSGKKDKRSLKSSDTSATKARSRDEKEKRDHHPSKTSKSDHSTKNRDKQHEKDKDHKAHKDSHTKDSSKAHRHHSNHINRDTDPESSVTELSQYDRISKLAILKKMTSTRANVPHHRRTDSRSSVSSSSSSSSRRLISSFSRNAVRDAMSRISDSCTTESSAQPHGSVSPSGVSVDGDVESPQVSGSAGISETLSPSERTRSPHKRTSDSKYTHEKGQSTSSHKSKSKKSHEHRPRALSPLADDIDSRDDGITTIPSIKPIISESPSKTPKKKKIFRLRSKDVKDIFQRISCSTDVEKYALGDKSVTTSFMCHNATSMRRLLMLPWGGLK
ncbi:hypothetical protein ADUPG1_011585 [Aduncisulcus paluster]|uniref:Uncharacterized protein n=1 Tax=Aduncisulcus paluster TaxID=2918883 RepID=A0ABQ5JYQ4_9EUKA|nr:hypothetical protein ADUPG1_011585 [Aduncisulcus paluster]